MGKHARQKSEIIRGDNQHGHTVEFECLPSAKKLREMYVILDGRRIAYRGQPGTSETGTWVSIVPGYTVFDVPFPLFWRQGAGLCDLHIERRSGVCRRKPERRAAAGRYRYRVE